MDFGYPDMTDSFLFGQDILYGQFNEISFYVEDEDKQNFYYVILKKLFTEIEFIKIFPLNGKKNVKEEANLNLGDKKKVYIVDKDFDDILGIIETSPNLFYLDRYSIENYLIEGIALTNYLIEEKPKLKVSFIHSVLDIDSLIYEAYELFKNLTSVHLVVQQFSLGIENVNQSPERYCTYTPTSLVVSSQLNLYKSQVNSALKAINIENDLDSKISNNAIFFDRGYMPIDSLKNIPGKYLLKFIKQKIEHLFSLSSKGMDTFTYRMAKNCSFDSLNFLKVNILSYIEL